MEYTQSTYARASFWTDISFKLLIDLVLTKTLKQRYRISAETILFKREQSGKLTLLGFTFVVVSPFSKNLSIESSGTLSIFGHGRGHK